jgi:DNA-binding transcriptional MocR family regulator
MDSTYLQIANEIERDIAGGRLRPGDRLPPQREFAFARKLAVSTVSRAYGELIRRGSAVGEVGRGTFIRASDRPANDLALTEPRAYGAVDLEMNYPILAGQADQLAGGLKGLIRTDLLTRAISPATVRGSAAGREAAAGMLAGPGWSPSREAVLFAVGGRQAIAAAISACVAPGEALGVEALTYPVVKGIAARLGVRLAPLAMDEDGLRPDAVEQAHRDNGVRVIYLQPSLQNPLGITMSAARRRDLADTLLRLDLIAIEDAVYRFLAPEESPLAAYAPDRVILIDSLSKRVAPGLTLGFLAAPADLVEPCASALQQGGWSAGGFALEVGSRWIAEGVVNELAGQKRLDAQARQAVARQALASWTVRGDQRAYHLWLELPDTWRAETFMAAALQQGIGLVPGAAFAVARGHAPNAVRLALASPPEFALRQALATLARLLSAPGSSIAE